MTCYIFNYSLLDTLDKAQLNLRMDCGELAACFIRYMCRLTRVDYVWETVRHLITLQSLFQQIKKCVQYLPSPSSRSTYSYGRLNPLAPDVIHF